MKRVFFKILLISFLFTLTPISLGQAYFNPVSGMPSPVVGVGSKIVYFNTIQTAASTFDVAQELLTLPQVTLFPGGLNPPQILLNVKMRHTGENKFELLSIDNLTPQQECTRAEVRAAIPQLSLNLDVASAESLIGCDARITRGSTDLELGRLVYAVFQGEDGVPNSNGNSDGFIGGTSTNIWIPQSGIPVAFNPFRVSGGPSITLAFREGNLESYTYTNEQNYSQCINVDFELGFGDIATNDSFEDISTKLNCEGNLLEVFRSNEIDQTSYSWQSQSYPTTLDAQQADRVSQTIMLSIVNNLVLNRQLLENINRTVDNACSVDEIVTGANAVQLGEAIENLNQLLPCAAHLETLRETESSKEHSFVWYSEVPYESIFTSNNRSLTVKSADGIVTSVTLTRL